MRIKGMALVGALFAATGCGESDGQQGNGSGSGREFANWPVSQPAHLNVMPDTVEDATTGLVWERRASAELMDWANAQAHCGELDAGGASDWRLPSRIELLSIVDYARSQPAIDPEAFPGTRGEPWNSSYWTTSPWRAEEPGVVFAVEFSDGTTNSESFDEFDDAWYVRCVRGGKDAPRALEPAEKTVTDTGTGLVWQRGYQDGPVDLAAAATYCDGLELAGADDWRLPTVRELPTLILRAEDEVFIDTDAFPGTPPEPFWTSTASVAEPGDTWVVSFGGEYTGTPVPSAWVTDFIDDGPHVRCVRGG